MLIDPNGATVATQDESGISEGETINTFAVPLTGIYEVRVSAVGSTSGDYGIVLSDRSSETNRLFHSTLVYGNRGFGTMLESTDHLWSFTGNTGDVISIVAEPGSAAQRAGDTHGEGVAAARGDRALGHRRSRESPHVVRGDGEGARLQAPERQVEVLPRQRTAPRKTQRIVRLTLRAFRRY